MASAPPILEIPGFSQGPQGQNDAAGGGAERREGASEILPGKALQRPSQILGRRHYQGFRGVYHGRCGLHEAVAGYHEPPGLLRPSGLVLGLRQAGPGENLPRRRLGVGRIALRAARLAPRPSRHHHLIHAVPKLKEPSRQAGAVRAGPLDADARCRAAYLAGEGIVALRVRGEPECPDCSPHVVEETEGVGVFVGVDAGKDEVFLQLAHMQPFRSTLAIRSEPKAG